MKLLFTKLIVLYNNMYEKYKQYLANVIIISDMMSYFVGAHLKKGTF